MQKNGIIKRIAILLGIAVVMFGVTSCVSQGVTAAYQEEKTNTPKTMSVDISLEGGTGKAYIESPVEVIEADGKMTAKLVWSSRNYDYMIVNGIRYDNENTGGPSTFTVDIDNITEPLTVIADTVAMSTPHEIEYVIIWGEKDDVQKEDTVGAKADKETVKKSLEAAGLNLSDSTKLRYAKGFSIDRYEDYVHISIENSGDYLLIPEGCDVPEGIPDSVVILQKPLDATYLVSTSSMDLVNACGALDRVALSGTKEEDWYIDEAKAAMENENLVYAGKYSAPDYELILESGCDLAIENTMIYHTPAVKEKLEELGIPVFVETSSYEEHPLGRLEWIKVYGALFDKASEAETFFDDRLKAIEPLLEEKPDTGKTIAFFHVTANGMINTRRSGDYITEMIRMSGGKYVPNVEGDSGQSGMNMQMEDFYAAVSDADFLIYNSTIGGQIYSVDELIGKNVLFKDFKAVKNSNVYCTKRDLFQRTTGIADFVRDLNDIQNGVEREYTYLYKLE